MPPRGLPPARTVVVEGRGEFFLRDTDPTAAAGDDRPVVVLLHGWLVTADLNWHTAYGPLSEAGYRVLALDHRGHGRGLRPLVPFRLADCAADVAALLRTLGSVPPPSSATRWAARSLNWSLGITRTSSPGWCSAAPASTSRIRTRSGSGSGWALPASRWASPRSSSSPPDCVGRAWPRIRTPPGCCPSSSATTPRTPPRPAVSSAASTPGRGCRRSRSRRRWS